VWGDRVKAGLPTALIRVGSDPRAIRAAQDEAAVAVQSDAISGGLG